MKVSVGVLTVASLFVSPIAFGYADKNDTKDTGEVKWNLEYFEKTFALKVKTHTLDAKEGMLIFLFEFTKDLEDTSKLKEVFVSPSAGGEPKVLFHLFDKDNVSVGSVYIIGTRGELSGKQGEAFRATTNVVNPMLVPSIRKIEARFVGKQTK